MVVEVALYHGPQPLPDFGHWLMPASPKLLPYCFEFCGESLTDSLAIDREAAGFPVVRADVREPQEVKRLPACPGLAAFGLRLRNARTQSGVFCPDVVPTRTYAIVPSIPGGNARHRLVVRTPRRYHPRSA